MSGQFYLLASPHSCILCRQFDLLCGCLKNCIFTWNVGALERRVDRWQRVEISTSTTFIAYRMEEKCFHHQPRLDPSFERWLFSCRSFPKRKFHSTCWLRISHQCLYWIPFLCFERNRIGSFKETKIYLDRIGFVTRPDAFLSFKINWPRKSDSLIAGCEQQLVV